LVYRDDITETIAILKRMFTAGMPTLCALSRIGKGGAEIRMIWMGRFKAHTYR
jgi:hypothetical protein